MLTFTLFYHVKKRLRVVLHRFLSLRQKLQSEQDTDTNYSLRGQITQIHTYIYIYIYVCIRYNFIYIY